VRLFLALIFLIVGWPIAAGIMIILEMMFPEDRRD